MRFYTNFSNFNKDLWEVFIKNHTNSNTFQSFEMFEFWKNQQNYNSIIFFIESDDGECLAFCTGVIMYNGKSIMKLLSKRAIFFGGPLINENENKEEILNFLVLKMEGYLKKKSIYTEIRNFYSDLYLKEIFNTSKWTYRPYQNYIITLNSEEEVFSKIKPEKRRQIRKALREGVQISYDKTDINIKGVYDVLVKIYKEKVKKPLPTFEFFISLMKLNVAGIVSIQYEDKIIGGGFFLRDDQNIYDWYRGGLDYDYKKQYPSTIAAWAVLKFGLDNDLKMFDFMGAGLKGEEYGVRKFKSQFGGELVEYGRFLKINNPIVYKMGETALKILKK